MIFTFISSIKLYFAWQPVINDNAIQLSQKESSIGRSHMVINYIYFRESFFVKVSNIYVSIIFARNKIMTTEERARFQENNKTGRLRLHCIRMQSREDFPLFASNY